MLSFSRASILSKVKKRRTENQMRQHKNYSKDQEIEVQKEREFMACLLRKATIKFFHDMLHVTPREGQAVPSNRSTR